MRLCIGYSVIYTVYYIVEFKQQKKKCYLFYFQFIANSFVTLCFLNI